MSDKNDLKQKLECLKKWFAKNSKLPEDIHPTLLKRFLKCTDMDLEETKLLIEHNYSLRNKSAHIFIDRDPNNEITKKSYFCIEKVPLPGLTPDNYKVVCFRLINEDASEQNSLEEAKCFFMMADVRLTTADVEDDNGQINNDDVDMSSLASGEIHVMDLKNYTLRHMANMSIMVMRAYMNYMQEAYPVGLKAMHVINCPSYLNRMLAIAKPFIREEVFKLYHFHTEGLDSLYEHIPRDMLPIDYGGKAASLSDISNEWWNIVQSKSDYLKDPRYWQIPKEESRSGWLWW